MTSELQATSYAFRHYRTSSGIGCCHAVLQCLEKVCIPLENVHILSRCNQKRKFILLGFYVMDQHKVEHNCEVEGKL